MTAWHEGPLVSFDTETSGINPLEDRIVTAAVVVPGQQPLERLAAVEVDIHPKAQAVHGISVEYARANGAPPAVVIEEVCASLAKHLIDGAALVVMNAPFDLTLLDAECQRYGVPTLAERIGRPVGPVIDPLVLDRAVDKYRPGRRNLETLAKLYGVELTGAHQAGADAVAALEVARAIGAQYEALDVPAEVLHRWQVTWHQRWAEGYEAHLRKSNASAVVERGWPLKAAL